MKGASGLFFVGLCLGWASSQFLNHRPFPTYSLENMPDTQFTCRDKILGGYYADPDTECQMFHICVKVSGVGVQDFRFLCPNGTAFDQDHQICAEWEDVDCDAATLYYSSDNFDLYRIGSGLESKAVKYGEEEEPFALQRAETGDARLSREHQTQRVNQQKEANIRYNNNYNRQNNDREIFKGSSSSSFFNNKNGGKEDDDDDTGNTNFNQDNDRLQKKKLVRKQQRRPVAQEARTPEPNRYTNNYAGSSYEPTTPKPTEGNGRRYRLRVNNGQQQQANKAETPAFVPSTPAPFRQTQQYNNINRQNNNGQYNPTTLAPKTKEPENYPSNFPNKKTTAYSKPTAAETYPTTIPANQLKQTSYPTTQPATNTQYNTNYETTKVKQTETYPTTNTFSYPTTLAPKPFQKTNNFNKPADNNFPTTFAPRTNAAYSQIAQQTNQYKQQNNQQQYNQQQSVNYKPQYSQQQTTQYNQQQTGAPQYNTQQPGNTQYNNKQPANTQYNTQQPGNTQYNTQQPGNTQYNQQQTTQYNTQQPGNTQYNTQQPGNAQYNQQQTTQYNPQNTYNTQYDNTRQQNYNTNTTPRTSPYTQYTPTVPKVTTVYQPTTTPVSRSARFDETQYDDGSYDHKYDNYDNGELINTAHSQNIASSRNELAKNNKPQQQQQQQQQQYNNAPTPKVTQKPYYESPRPFSVSPATPKTTQSVAKSTPKPTGNKKPEPPKNPAKEKNVSYDYAYYDTNSGSELEYDINTEIEKSDKARKQ